MLGWQNEFDLRPYATLPSGGRISLRELRGLRHYTCASVYRHDICVGQDLPPTMIDSIWRQRVCAFCMEPLTGDSCHTRIIPPSWGGARGGWNMAECCGSCQQKKSCKAGYVTFDGRTGYYWTGLPWHGNKVKRLKTAREFEPFELVSRNRHEVEKILPHRYGGIHTDPNLIRMLLRSAMCNRAEGEVAQKQRR